MASVYARLGSKVTHEFQNAIGAGMDAEVANNPKLLAKQGLDFKLGTKVERSERDGEVVKIEVEDVKSGKNLTLKPMSCWLPLVEDHLLKV